LFSGDSGGCAIAARVRAGSEKDRELRRENVFLHFALAKKLSMNHGFPDAFARFAQDDGMGSQYGNSSRHSGFGIRFQIISSLNIFSTIVPAGIYGSGAWIIFKWLTVLYVDPQNLMTNRRNLPSGMVSVPREKHCRQQGINNPETYIVSP
jgi:hypothetical protein